MARIPAKRIGWACECENVLGETLKCLCGRKYKENSSHEFAEIKE